MLKNPHARLANKLAQDPFAEQKQKMTMYFVLSSFGIQFTAAILCLLTVYVLLEPHMLDMERDVLASVGIDSEALEGQRQNLEQLLDAHGIDPALSPEERSAQSVEFKVALEEWAAQQEEFNTKALVVAGQTGVEPEQAAKNIQDTMAMEMLPYMALCVLVSFLLSSGVFLGWLKGFLFRRDFDGYRLGLRGKRGAVELTASRLGEIAWALVWRWGALGSALCLIIKVLDTLGITKAFVTLGIGPALLLFGGGCKTGGMGSAMGGGAMNTAFGGQGADKLLVKITSGLAFTFMALAIIIGMMDNPASRIDYNNKPTLSRNKGTSENTVPKVEAPQDIQAIPETKKIEESEQ